MTPKQEARARELIAKQVSMSGQTLVALRSAGMTDAMLLPIQFYFAAPNEKAASSLCQHLQDNDCLDVRAEKTGRFLARKWIVVGRTHPTPINPSVLGEWIPWIVVQGIVHDCEFDGWGAEV